MDIRLIDISRSGCLLESTRQVAPGSTGEICIDFDGRVFTEMVRVTRCRHIEGAGEIYRLGAEFIRTRPLHDGSLRRAVDTLIEAGGSMTVATARIVTNGQ
jgi:hypothetical protein